MSDQNILFKIIPKISCVSGGIALSLLTIFVILGTLSRTIFNHSILFAIEYSEYLVPIVAIWSAAYILSIDGHVRADVVMTRIPGKPRLLIDIFGYILGLTFTIALSVLLFDLAFTSLKSNITSMYPLRTPLGYPQLFLPIGLLLFAIQIIFEIIKKIRMIRLMFKT